MFMDVPEPSDGVVTVEETRLAGLSDHIVLPVSHSGMLVSAQAARQVAVFLERGAFDHGGRAASGHSGGDPSGREAR